MNHNRDDSHLKNNILTNSPLHRLEREMAQKSFAKSDVDDNESIYSFDSVSTNGRLLDKIDLDDELQSIRPQVPLKDLNRNINHNDPFQRNNQQRNRQLDQINLNNRVPVNSRHSGYPTWHGVSRQNHSPIVNPKQVVHGQVNNRIDQYNSVPKFTQSPAYTQRGYPKSSQSIPQNNQSQSIPNEHKQVLDFNSTNHHLKDEDYNIKQVSNTIEQNDNQSIISLRADMTSLESVASISQPVQGPFDGSDESLASQSTLKITASTTPETPQPSQSLQKTESLPDPTIDLTPKVQPFVDSDSLISDANINDNDNKSHQSGISSPFLKHKPLPLNLNRNSQFRLDAQPSQKSPQSLKSQFSGLSNFSNEWKKEQQQLSPSQRTQYAVELRNKGEHREASYQLQIAANVPNNYPQAMYLYALALRFGKGVKLNERNSIKWLLRCILICYNNNAQYAEKLAEAIPDDLILVVDKLLETNRIDPWHLYEQMRQLQQSQISKIVSSIKMQQNIEALAYHELGLAVLNGWGIDTKNEALGIKILSKAASLGSFDSMSQLGDLYSTKTKFHKKDYHLAAVWYRLSELFGQKSIGNSWIYKQKYMKKKN